MAHFKHLAGWPNSTQTAPCARKLTSSVARLEEKCYVTNTSANPPVSATVQNTAKLSAVSEWLRARPSRLVEQA